MWRQGWTDEWINILSVLGTSHLQSRLLFVSLFIRLNAFVVTEMQLSIHLLFLDMSFEVNGGILQPNADCIAHLAAAASWPSCEQATVLVLLIQQPKRPAKTQRPENSWNFGTDLTLIGSGQSHQNLYSLLMTIGCWHPWQHEWKNPHRGFPFLQWPPWKGQTTWTCKD